MKNYPLVVLVLPVHNNKEDTKEFLESLKQTSYPNYKVIIIDDGSTDGTEEMLRQEYPGVILLKGDGNLWWSGATNMGIEKAIDIKADYVLLGGMNDTVVDSKFISTLVDTAEKNPKSIVTSKVYHYGDPKRIQLAGGDINWLKYWRSLGIKGIGSGDMDKGQHDAQRDVKFATMSILVRTTFLSDIGMIDSKTFPQYWGDTDFTYRAYKKGYRIIYEPKSMVWHKDCSTVKKHTNSKMSLPQRFIFNATNKRTGYNIHDIINFYSRHAPKYYLPYMLMRFFYLVIERTFRKKYYNR